MSGEKPGGLNPPPADTRFKPGQSGNPGGLARGTRNKLNATFLNALSADFDEHGKQAIRECREQHPEKYVQVVAALLPKQIEPSLPLDDMTDEQLIASLDYLRQRVTDRSGAGSNTPTRTQ